MDTAPEGGTAAPATVPMVKGWNAPRSEATEGPAIPLDRRASAVALAEIVSLAPIGTPISIPQMSARLGDAWEAGVEQVVDYLTEHAAATQAGEGDGETVAFVVAPHPAYV